MSALTDLAAERTLAWLTGQSTTAPVLPLKVALYTIAGDDIVAGTEVVGGGYGRQTFTPAVPSTSGGGATTVRNANIIRFNNMPAITVVSFAIWDSASTPFRWLSVLRERRTR
jgi:hypothetical protein